MDYKERQNRTDCILKLRTKILKDKKQWKVLELGEWIEEYFRKFL